jgi:hypothetical protein
MFYKVPSGKFVMVASKMIYQSTAKVLFRSKINLKNQMFLNVKFSVQLVCCSASMSQVKPKPVDSRQFYKDCSYDECNFRY